MLGAISLRRTKEVPDGGEGLVGLPPKTVETCLVELSAEERECYDKMESEAQNTVREFINSDTVLRNYSTVLHIILRLRQICDDVALCPPNIKSLLPSNALEGISLNISEFKFLHRRNIFFYFCQIYHSKLVKTCYLLMDENIVIMYRSYF